MKYIQKQCDKYPNEPTLISTGFCFKAKSSTCIRLCEWNWLTFSMVHSKKKMKKIRMHISSMGRLAPQTSLLSDYVVKKTKRKNEKMYRFTLDVFLKNIKQCFRAKCQHQTHHIWAWIKRTAQRMKERKRNIIQMNLNNWLYEWIFVWIRYWMRWKNHGNS